MPKLLFIVNNPDFFVSHRLEIGKAANREGYEVHLAAPYGEGVVQIQQAGIRTHLIDVDPSDHGWAAQFRFMLQVLLLCRKLQPDICHMITLKTFLVAGFAARLARVPSRIGSISGLGYLFISESFKTRFFRAFLRPFFAWVMTGNDVKVIFQNDTDKELMKSFVGIRDQNTEMIRGSGVDLNKYKYTPEAPGPIKVVMASRLLKDKGVMEYLEAARMLKRQGTEAEFLLAGEPDNVNPAAVTSRELKPYLDDGSVNWIGHCDDISRLFSQCNIVVLPSYREGFPKVLIEAAACGRAIVTTDVPGCRDAIVDGKTGLMVKVFDKNALAKAIKKLVMDGETRVVMGVSGREMAEAYFSVDSVVEKHLRIFGGLKKLSTDLTMGSRR